MSFKSMAVRAASFFKPKAAKNPEKQSVTETAQAEPRQPDTPSKTS